MERRNNRLARAEEEDNLLVRTDIDPRWYSVPSLRHRRRDTGQHREKHRGS
jgi:hypothetical protein